MLNCPNIILFESVNLNCKLTWIIGVSATLNEWLDYCMPPVSQNMKTKNKIYTLRVLMNIMINLE